MFKRTFIIILTLLTCNVLEAETLRLNRGEALKGDIRVMDEKTLFLDSTLTSKQLKINRSDIRLIEFDSAERSLTRRLGIGLYYRPNSSAEEISFKNWISATDAVGLQLGYKDGNTDLFKVEVRFSRVFLKEGQHDLYYGVGLGMHTENSTRGTLIRVFTGSELFPVTNPNIGLGVEIGVLQNSSEQTFFHAITARYYF